MRAIKLTVAAVVLLAAFSASADPIVAGGAYPGDFTLLTTNDVIDDFANPLEVEGLATISANSIAFDNATNDFNAVAFSTVESMSVVGASDMSGSFVAGEQASITSLIGPLFVDLLIADSAALIAQGSTVSLTNAQDIMVGQSLTIVADTIFVQFTDGSDPDLNSLNAGSLDFGDAEVIVSSVATSVPEPGTLALLAIGLFGIGSIRRSKGL